MQKSLGKFAHEYSLQAVGTNHDPWTGLVRIIGDFYSLNPIHESYP